MFKEEIHTMKLILQPQIFRQGVQSWGSPLVSSWILGAHQRKRCLRICRAAARSRAIKTTLKLTEERLRQELCGVVSLN